MSFAELASGASCGPTNGLQQLGKRFGADRSAQQDRFAGPSSAGGAEGRGAFRSTQARTMGVATQDLAFAQAQHQQQQQQPFDLAPLAGALPFAQPIGPAGPHLGGVAHFNNAPNVQHQQQRTPNFDAAFRQPQPALHQQPQQRGWANEYEQRAESPMLQQQHSQHAQQQQQQQGRQGGAAYQPRYAQMGSRAGLMLQQQPRGGMQQQQQRGTQEDAYAQVDSSKWDTAFTSYDEAAMHTSEPSPRSLDDMARFSGPSSTLQGPRLGPDTRPSLDQTANEADDLARTAGRLVDTVSHETNDKFKGSQFLGLMRKLRDRQAGIEGKDIVDHTSASTSAEAEAAAATSSGKGKARQFDAPMQPENAQQAFAWSQANGTAQQQRGVNTMAPPVLDTASELAARAELNDVWAEEDARSAAVEEAARQRAARAFTGDAGDVTQRMNEDDAEAREWAKYARHASARVGGASHFRTAWEEEDTREEAGDFVGRGWQGAQGRGRNGAQTAEWDKLQNDWDEWQAGPTGLQHAADRARSRPVSAKTAPAYRFQEENPYVGATRTHAAHVAADLPHDVRSILEREAAVQADPRDAAAWLDLGVKQQENEREGLAIAALHRAIEIDAQLGDAWLALAVSYTNENDREAALEATERWISTLKHYGSVVAAHEAAMGKLGAEATPTERHARLTDTLIAIARSGSASGGSVDADVQVALGVLFNASEDYEKAVDCFSAALSVRPDDWLLYNRLGATLSNSGRSSEAIGYYHHALGLQPGFVRCHFNLSISCLNLKMYRDAASHIYTALTLQATNDSAQAQLQPDVGLDGKEAGVTSSSLWETLRVSLELLGRSDLADLTSKRDIHAFDPADFFEGEGQDSQMQF